MSRLWLMLLALLSLGGGAAHAEPPVQVTSPGGITAWLSPDPSSPKIAFSLAFRGGRAADPWDGVGLSDLALEAMMQGIDDLDRRALVGRLADLTASVNWSARVDWIAFDFTMVRDKRAETVALFHRLLTTPHPSGERIERASFNVMGDINAAERDPEQLATLALRRAIAPDHPMLHAWLPAMTAVDHPSREKLQDWYRTRFAKDEMLIGVGGGVTAAELAPMLDQLFGDMPAHGKVPTIEPLSPTVTWRPLVLVPRAEGETTLAALALGPMIGDPDFMAFEALDKILGADPITSRLGAELRERRGLTYGISSGIDGNELIVSGTVANADVAQAVKSLREIWPSIGRDGISETELAEAKRKLREDFTPTRPATALDAAYRMLFFQQYGLSEHWNADMLAAVEALTAADVVRLAKQVLGPAPLAIALVGRPTGVTPGCTLADPLRGRC